MDLFEWRKLAYLIIVDYYSRFIQIVQLDRTTAEVVILNIFSRHGIPEEVITDNGSQFDSNVFHKFLLVYQFRHVISSLYYPKSNGKAERGVKTRKGLLNKGYEPYLALLTHRSTPFPMSIHLQSS